MVHSRLRLHYIHDISTKCVLQRPGTFTASVFCSSTSPFGDQSHILVLVYPFLLGSIQLMASCKKSLKVSSTHRGFGHGGTPSYHPFLDGFSTDHPAIGVTPMTVETPICCSSNVLDQNQDPNGLQVQSTVLWRSWTLTALQPDPSLWLSRGATTWPGAPSECASVNLGQLNMLHVVAMLLAIEKLQHLL